MHSSDAGRIQTDTDNWTERRGAERLKHAAGADGPGRAAGRAGAVFTRIGLAVANRRAALCGRRRRKAHLHRAVVGPAPPGGQAYPPARTWSQDAQPVSYVASDNTRGMLGNLSDQVSELTKMKENLHPLQPKVFGVQLKRNFEGISPLKYEMLSFEKCLNY